MKNTLPLGSFPLQSSLNLQKYYQAVVSVVLLLLLLFKSYNLPYTTILSAQDGIVQFLMFIFGYARIRIGIIGNKTEDFLSMIVFFVGTALVVFFCFYFIFLQSYTLLIQIILMVILILFCLFDVIFGLFSSWQFQSYQKQQ